MAEFLPVEVLSHIFSYLSLSDRKEVSLVNRQWYSASLDPMLQKDVVITFIPGQEHILPSDRHKKTPHLVLNNIDTSLKYREVLENTSHYLGENLQSLSLKGTDLTEKTFVSLMSHCKSLVKLDLSCCNSLFMSGQLLEKTNELKALQKVLGNVKELNLASIRYLSDATFNRIATVCHNVEVLSLASCNILYHGTYYPEGATRFANASVLTFINIMAFLQEQQKQLKGLNLSRTDITNQPLIQIAKIPDLKLQHLTLMACRDLSDEGIVGLSKHQKTLENLDLSCCSDLTDNCVYSILSKLSKLKQLNLSKCMSVTDISLKQLSQLNSLELLDVSACYQIMSKGMIKGLCTGKLVRLTHLKLNCCSMIRDEFVLQACENLKQLIHLDLGSCFPITDLSVHAISKNLKHLRLLRLAWCKQITDFGLLGLQREDAEHHLHNVEHGTCRCTRKADVLNIFNKPKGGETKIQLSWDDAKEHLLTNEELYTLGNLSNLRSLDLSACPNLSDSGVGLALTFTELHFLNLSMCPLLTDKALVAIASNNPSLENIFISQCKHITDDGIGSLVKKLPRLTVLDISSCDLLTNLAIEMIAMYSKRLRNLDVSLCSGITMKGLQVLEKKRGNMCSIQKRMISD